MKLFFLHPQILNNKTSGNKGLNIIEFAFSYIEPKSWLNLCTDTSHPHQQVDLGRQFSG